MTGLAVAALAGVALVVLLLVLRGRGGGAHRAARRPTSVVGLAAVSPGVKSAARHGGADPSPTNRETGR